MSSAQAQPIRTVPRSWPRLWNAVAAISVLSGSCAWAQTAGDAGRGVQSARVQAAYAEWRRLSQTEVNCVDHSLRGQGTSLWLVIQRGVDPSDSAIARVRAACRTQAKAPDYSVAAQRGSQALAAAVDNAAEKAAADRAAEKAAAEKAAADKAAIEKAAAKAAADKAAADKVADDKAAADKLAADKAAAEKAAAAKVAADKAAMDTANADAERAKAAPVKAQADSERPQKDAEKTTAETVLAYSAAELRTSFVYGLISGPIVFGLGGFVFLLFQRKRNMSAARTAPDSGGMHPGEFDRLVTAVLAEQKRREVIVH